MLGLVVVELAVVVLKLGLVVELAVVVDSDDSDDSDDSEVSSLSSNSPSLSDESFESAPSEDSVVVVFMSGLLVDDSLSVVDLSVDRLSLTTSSDCSSAADESLDSVPSSTPDDSMVAVFKSGLVDSDEPEFGKMVSSDFSLLSGEPLDSAPSNAEDSVVVVLKLGLVDNSFFVVVSDKTNSTAESSLVDSDGLGLASVEKAKARSKKAATSFMLMWKFSKINGLLRHFLA